MTMRMPFRSDSSRMSEIESCGFAMQLGDALDQAGLVELIDLVDDDGVATANFFDHGFAAIIR